MSKIIYITGGARSGKSSMAEEIASGYEHVAYIATAKVTDEEMRSRIQKHRLRRPADWATFEQYTGIDSLILQGGYDVYLLDCMTVMLTNLIFDASENAEEPSLPEQEEIENGAAEEMRRILRAARVSGCDLILVTNEVGMGLVPEYPLGRFFRDAAGRINRIAAAEADEAYLMVSGIPLKLKGG
jgi:adenosylcobinamide kinase/adenosylcobinamide-phosphate guanylyltransferase